MERLQDAENQKLKMKESIINITEVLAYVWDGASVESFFNTTDDLIPESGENP